MNHDPSVDFMSCRFNQNKCQSYISRKKVRDKWRHSSRQHSTAQRSTAVCFVSVRDACRQSGLVAIHSDSMDTHTERERERLPRTIIHTLTAESITPLSPTTVAQMRTKWMLPASGTIRCNARLWTTVACHGWIVGFFSMFVSNEKKMSVVPCPANNNDTPTLCRSTKRAPRFPPSKTTWRVSVLSFRSDSFTACELGIIHTDVPRRNVSVQRTMSF